MTIKSIFFFWKWLCFRIRAGKVTSIALRRRRNYSRWVRAPVSGAPLSEPVRHSSSLPPTATAPPPPPRALACRDSETRARVVFEWACAEWMGERGRGRACHQERQKSRGKGAEMQDAVRVTRGRSSCWVLWIAALGGLAGDPEHPSTLVPAFPAIPRIGRGQGTNARGRTNRAHVPLSACGFLCCRVLCLQSPRFHSHLSPSPLHPVTFSFLFFFLPSQTSHSLAKDTAGRWGGVTRLSRPHAEAHPALPSGSTHGPCLQQGSRQEQQRRPGVAGLAHSTRRHPTPGAVGTGGRGPLRAPLVSASTSFSPHRCPA